MAVARGGGPRWTGSMDRGGGGTPRGAHVAPTRRTRGGHVAATRAAGLDGPDLPPGRSDGGGGSRPARTGAAQAGPAAMAHGGAAPAVQGGDRPTAEGGGVAATRTATAAAKRLGGAGEGEEGEEARVGVMERGGPCDGLCRFRIHLGTRGDCPLPCEEWRFLQGVGFVRAIEDACGVVFPLQF
uniref:Uncharacterized protein n=1 Tax=Oryza sativa subsp. japonica TaxID=39947 RepID=Q5VMF6_ORYSJ|nr:hypothetical protein [Oryza sativa Japonica Group]